jgi:type VI secretion system protein ImpF
MARELERPIKLSVLDRLLEDDTAPPGQDLTALRESVRRDVELLLNTRRIFLQVPDDFPELQKSVYHFGIPDITSLGRDAPSTRAMLVTYLEEALAFFEPRLINVRATVGEAGADVRRRLHFRIHAMLVADPEPVKVSFDTVIDRTNGGVKVLEGSS